MAQNDFSIANQGFPSFRSDLNDALQSLASNSSGTTEPPTTYAYQWWYDETNDILKIRNSANDAWIDFATFDQTTGSWSLASLDVTGDAKVSGDLTVDTNTLYVDSANDRVGIGTSSPSTTLDVNGDVAVSGGIYLGGTGSANKLDDYEEGTWTPTYTSSGTNPTFAPSLQNGVYTKVGRIVYASFRLRGAITGTKTGNLQISGLPFANNNSPATGSGAVRFTENFGTNKFPTGLGVEPSDTYISLTTFDSDSARNQQFTAIDVASTSASSSGNYIIGHVVYQTD